MILDSDAPSHDEISDPKPVQPPTVPRLPLHLAERERLVQRVLEDARERSRAGEVRYEPPEDHEPTDAEIEQLLSALVRRRASVAPVLRRILQGGRP